MFRRAPDVCRQKTDYVIAHMGLPELWHRVGSVDYESVLELVRLFQQSVFDYFMYLLSEYPAGRVEQAVSTGIEFDSEGTELVELTRGGSHNSMSESTGEGDEPIEPYAFLDDWTVVSCK